MHVQYMFSINCWKTFPKHLHGYISYDGKKSNQRKYSLSTLIYSSCSSVPKGYVNAHIPINDSLSLVRFLSDTYDIHFYKFNICIGHLGNYLNQQLRTLSNFLLRQIHQQAVFATLIFEICTLSPYYTHSHMESLVRVCFRTQAE